MTSNKTKVIFKIITRVAQDYKDFAIVQNALAEIVDAIRKEEDND